MEFTEDQQAALASMTLLYPNGLTLTEDRIEDIEVCESLVESGHAVRIEGDGFEGNGYQLSPEMAEAHRRYIASQADDAAMN